MPRSAEPAGRQHGQSDEAEDDRAGNDRVGDERAGDERAGARERDRAGPAARSPGAAEKISGSTWHSPPDSAKK